MVSRVAGLATPASAMLEVRGVHKAYGPIVALDGVDLYVGAGTIVGLLGPNGAGKTSLVSIVAGLRRPDAGVVRVDGIDMARAPHHARTRIGLAPQDTGVYLPLTVRDNLRYFAGLTDVPRRDVRRRVEEIAGALMLDALMDRQASALSGGERRRLHTAIALVHHPRLILLDEPTTGADVQTRREILRLVRTLADEGAAVVYSTHYLHEIEDLEARIAFIDRGRIVACGELADLLARYGSSALELTFDGAVPAMPGVEGAVVTGSTVRIPSDDPAAMAAQLLAQLGQNSASLRAIEVARPSLESVFIAVTGRAYDHAAVVAA